MHLVAPLLAEMAINAAVVASAVLSARVALFCVRFVREVVNGLSSR